MLSRVFRGKFLSKLKQAYAQSDLQLKGSIAALQREKNFKQLLNTLYQKQWVVYAKKPFGNAGHVLKYLGRYTHRIAISNHRIVAMDKEKVRFKWKDYANDNQQKIMSLDAFEFIRRFLLHTLPKGFCKIRYYGISANKNRKTNVLLVRKWLSVPNPVYVQRKETWQQTLQRLTGFDVLKCPKCNTGQMKTILFIETCGPN